MGQRHASLENMAVASWRGRRVLVTGGSGFVGYWLASTLVQLGAQVTVLDIKPLPSFAVLPHNYKKRIHFVRGSVTSHTIVTQLIQKHKIQTIFHLAAEAIVSRSRKNPALTLDTNVRGTWTVLDAARKLNVNEVVVASSDKAYGVHKKLPYREDAALQGIYPYDCSKSATDLIAQMYAQTYGMHIAIARCGNIYGGGDLNGTRLIPDALRCIERDITFKIRSNGMFLRDYVYVSDAVSAYIAMAEGLMREKIQWGAFNFASNRPLSVHAVIKKLESASHKKLATITLDQAQNEIPDQYLDASKARRVLGWRPKVSLQEGFKKTAQWYHHFFMQGGALE
jgi:CDP-glucose 4,6-dehydratase